MTTPATPDNRRSFSRRMKAAVAGTVVAALATFGAVGMDAPEPADQEAGGTWSFQVDDRNDDKPGKGGKGGGFGYSTRGMTWS